MAVGQPNMGAHIPSLGPTVATPGEVDLKGIETSLVRLYNPQLIFLLTPSYNTLGASSPPPAKDFHFSIIQETTREILRVCVLYFCLLSFLWLLAEFPYQRVAHGQRVPHAAAFWEPLAKVSVKFASTIQATIAILLTVGLIALVLASQVRLPVVEGLPGLNAPATSTNVSTTQATAVILRKVAQIALASVFVAQSILETRVRPPTVQHVVASSEPHVKAPMKSASIIQTTIAIRSMVGPIALASASLDARLENARQYPPPDQPVQDQQARPAVVLQESPAKVPGKSASTTQVTIAIWSTVEPIALASAFL